MTAADAPHGAGLAVANDAATTWFLGWLGRAWPRVHRVLTHAKMLELLPVVQAVGVFGAIAAFFTALMQPDGRAQFMFYVNDVGHLLLLLAAVFLLVPHLGRPASARHAPSDSDRRASSQFQHWFSLLLALWILFYGVRGVADVPAAFGIGDAGPARGAARFAEMASPYVNVLSAIAFLGLYLVLSRPSIGRPAWGTGASIWRSVIVVLVVALVQLLADSSDGSARQQIDQVARILNGLVVGGAIALLVGRLDSKYIDFPPWVTKCLYLYAMLQPVYPYAFPPGDLVESARVMQYVLVSLALLMKLVLILSVARIIDDGTLLFYLGSIRWVDKHVTTLKARYIESMQQHGEGRAGPGLLVFVPPGDAHATLRVERLDVRIGMVVLNAWLGVGWDIERLDGRQLIVGSTELPIKSIQTDDMGSVRIDNRQRHTALNLFVELQCSRPQLIRLLRADPMISAAIRKNWRSVKVPVKLVEPAARTALLGGEALHHIPDDLEIVDGSNALCYTSTIEIAALEP